MISDEKRERRKGMSGIAAPLVIVLAALVVLSLGRVAFATATGSPATDLTFFQNSENLVGSTVVDLNSFDEWPISLNDYGSTSEKCGFWKCTAKSESAGNGKGEYCSGGWSCANWNGVTCANYNCTGWTNTGTAQRDVYCSSGYNCTSWNGTVCANWNCATQTSSSVNADNYYCSGIWNCTSFNGNSCGYWNCTNWSILAGSPAVDYHCGGGWNCKSYNGGLCSAWNCSGWTQASAINVDSYCSGQLNCTTWNGNVCDKWNCTAISEGALTTDMFCNSFNCTNWDSTKKVCGTWNCTNWTAGASTKLDTYCSGTYNCTSWQSFTYGPTTTLVSPSNDNVTTLNSVNFTCNATANTGILQNMTFYWNYSGAFIANGTTSVGGTSNQTTLARTNLNNGAIIWNCYACDNSSQCSFASANYTVTVNDTILPQVSITYPANTTYNTKTNLPLNYTATDNNAVSACWYSVDSGSNVTIPGCANTTFNVSSDGSHNVRVYANDTSNNTNSSIQYFTADTTAPTTSATAVNSSGGAYSFNTWTSSAYVNVTLSCNDGSGSGCNVTQYCTDATNTCTPFTTYTTPVQVTTENTSYIRYRSNDSATNLESIKNSTIKIDTTPPAGVTNLGESSTSQTWIYWNWTNPADSDFNHTEVWLNGTFKANVSVNYYNATGLNSSTTYQIQTRTADNTGNVNATWVNDTATTLTSCTENWTVNYGSCLTNDSKLKYYTDANSCGTYGSLPGDNGTYVGCNYCSYSVINGSWTAWQNQGSCLANDSQLQNRSKTEYDANYSTCYAVTNLSSDLWNSGNNNTYWDYNYTSCNYGAPYWTSVNASPTSPATYSPVQSYQFNTTWSDNAAISSVLFEHNFTGSVSNYSQSGNSSDVYFYNYGALATGTYYWKSWAKDNLDNWNSTSAQTFIVDKAAPVINLTLNGADSDISAPINTIVNISVALVTPPGIGVVELFENGVFITSTSTSTVVQTNYTTTGTKNWTARYNATQNYSSSSKTHLLSIVDPNGPQYTDIVASPSSPVTFSPTQNYQFNVTWTDTTGISNAILEFAGTNYSWQAGQLTKSDNVYSRNFGPMAAITYNYKWYANDTDNNNASTPTETYTIEKAITALFLTSSPSNTVTYNTSTSVGCLVYNPESSPSLTRNGTGVSNPDNATLAAGTYNYACTASATQNYSIASTTGSLTVSRATSTLSINLSPSSSIVYGTNATATCSVNNAEIGAQLYLDSAPVANPYTALLAAGNHTYTCNATASQNFTNATASSVLTVDKYSTATALLLNGLAANLTVTYPAQTNASAATDNLSVTLYRNGTPVNSSDVQTLAAGFYNYTAVNPGNENYSASSAMLLLNVTKAANPLDLSINGSMNQNVTEYLGNETAISSTITATAFAGAVHLLLDSVDVGSPYAANMSIGNYEFLASTAGNENYSANSTSFWLFVKPNVTETRFNGTDFSNISNYSSIPNVTLEIADKGKIAFSEAIVINRSIDVDANVNISSNYIFVNSTALPEFNKSATLQLYNLSFTNPKIMRDGVECGNCTKLSYIGGTLAFTVPSFSAYWAAESAVAPYCGDGTCNNGETCSSCSADCGTCQPSGGSSGNWSSAPPCTENWYCSDWTTCSNSVQNRTCSDRNKCGTAKNMPITNQACVSCQENWVCSEWSECTNSLQTRYCIDQSECSSTINKPREVQSCEEKPSENEIAIPQLVETQLAPKPELIALTIAMLFGLIGVLGLRSSQISRTMKKVLELAHVVLVLSIIGLLAMTFAEQPAASLINTVGQIVADNWIIAATLIGVVGMIGAELALRGFKLPKLRLPKKNLAKPHKLKHVEESEKWKQHQKHSELLSRIQSFEHVLDTKLARYGNMLESLHRTAKHVMKEHKKLKRENAELKHVPAYIAREEKNIIAFARSIQLPKLAMRGKRVFAGVREALLHAVPKFSIPKISVPKLSMHGKRVFASTREALLHAVPKLNMPKFTLPKFNVPKLSLPKLAVPKIKLPSIKINVPKLAFPRLNIPKLSIPKLSLPKLVMPKLAIPKVSIPKLAIPKIKILGPKVPRMTILKEQTAQPRELLPTESSFTVGEDVSQSISQILDLNPEEVKKTKQRTAMDKRHRAAIARMRAKFGLPARIPAHKHKPMSGFGRHQL